MVNGQFGSANLGVVEGNNSLGHVSESGDGYKSFAWMANNFADFW